MRQTLVPALKLLDLPMIRPGTPQILPFASPILPQPTLHLKITLPPPMPRPASAATFSQLL